MEAHNREYGFYKVDDGIEFYIKIWKNYRPTRFSNIIIFQEFYVKIICNYYWQAKKFLVKYREK
jgi:hypothetical protein